MKKKLILLASCFMALGALTSLAGCASKYDVKLTVYNWEDYIYEGTDSDGNYVDDSMVVKFEKYYKEKTGLKVKVDYENFSTCEDMYQMIKLGSISPDLICPSDYMIQRMANEGMLIPFSYDSKTGKYAESLENWEKYGSPYIKARYAAEKLEDGNSFLTYAVPYFWGTMGFTYDPSKLDPELMTSWEVLWDKVDDPYYQKKFSLKDSLRDTYVTVIFHVCKEEIAALDPNDPDYNAKLSDIFNKCDDETIAKVEAALKEIKGKTIYGFEVDDGKDAIVLGTYYSNFAWSGDAVYAMDQAEAGQPSKILNYSVPQEGSNVWFDGWCMPKGANKELAEEFVNFICNPENAALCMEAVGYTSPIAGNDIWELVNDWYAAEEDEEDIYEADLSFFFGDTIESEAKINIPTANKGRQFDAQYPSLDDLKRCCLMKDFGDQQEAVEAMWREVRA